MERRVIHSQPTRSSLLIGTRIIGVKILIREIAACTRLRCITATVAATGSPQSATGPTQAARATAETTAEAS